MDCFWYFNGGICVILELDSPGPHLLSLHGKKQKEYSLQLAFFVYYGRKP